MPLSIRPAFAALALTTLLLVACAEQPRRTTPAGLYDSTLANFKKADANNDEQLTREEMQAGMPQFSGNFDDIDTDHNGKVNFAELWSYVQFRYMQREPEPGAQPHRSR